MDKRTLVMNMDLKEAHVNRIQQALPNWRIVANKELEEVRDDLKEAEIILHWKKAIEPIVLAENKRLKWVQTWSAGIDNLPLIKLQQHNVLVTSANGVHAYPISETIFALILGLTRKIHTYVRQQQEKKWYHARLKQEIHHKTIGIIGVGAIGLETAKIAKAFGMKVLGVRHSGKPTDYVDQMYKPEQLDQVLSQSDFVVITLPLTDATRNMFTATQFKRMKDSAILINIGRGAIVNEGDLLQALQQNEIAGAGLDVFASEPLPANSPLWEMENVIVTPHTAGSTEHYDERVIDDIFLPNLQHYLKGEIPTVNLVNFEKGY
ncbi:D-2-hydroxyacid dehydrogenase [Virgibacillus pantothenticus]|uniref:D-2-hydroxyacid dehydrogenase n=1 Tax=Virgibacillus pantothenticus TaxID=1473 RepID=UPI001C2508C3|nr:D-2-hydroxyacid dehydrogenase [Virgibacillus pantothenticus]MBU8566488.1 D-2-hydroxyacid dehydrogenase [Virgibacillus pantothenticus]MBU8600097.1 D-2-hydroxyacid dehydrogenase [Virgibacillus pantothenticus]MBU8633971.1 D-2-hydroxyacid dehydrogenase [Virgibacillus pantothenticus]MBU8641964.1 D-2-hydroxyacid dehydrogenase [Virgibacillus pantothenticus]MBU8645748.1 D-2-hydroxyacid dehydrogenase [Virgibacillus pantothenticus]